jgi:hypothetical protein
MPQFEDGCEELVALAEIYPGKIEHRGLASKHTAGN